MRKAKIRSIRPAGAGLLPAIVLPLVLLLYGSAIAEEEATQFTDSSRERLPAVTAFPKYPSIARRDRIEGETTVCFHIDARGRIVRPSIMTSTHKIFEKAAMRAIRRSSFTPLEEGAELAPARTCRTYRFRLDPVSADNDAKSPLPESVDDATAPDEG